MLNKIISFLLLIFMVPLISLAEWIPLNSSNSADPATPKLTLLHQNARETIIKIELSGFEMNDFMVGRTTYQAVNILSEALTHTPGQPELPYVATILAIPDQASVRVEVVETGQESTFRNVYLPPARKSWYEGDTEPSYTEESIAYRADNLYPAEAAKLDPPAVFRDFRITRLSVFPVRYNAAKRELYVASSITVRVVFVDEQAINPRTAPKRPIAPSFGKIYRSTIFNYQEVLNEQYGGREDGRDLILCIMPDEFYNSFQVYAEWKRQSGTDVHVTRFSDIGANANNPDIIKNHIADAYHNWEYPPTYVLIVGDDGVFPKKIVTYPDYSFPNEDYFVEVDGNDYFPEMMIGRFTNQGDYRMQVMINKFLLYEKTPNTVTTDWFKKGTVCSNNAYESQKETKRFAAGMMLNYGHFTSVDTLMSDGSGWGWDCTVSLDDVIDAINEGRSYLNYRGEGWTSGWQASCYNFETSDVTSLTNGEHFTFVTSIGCGVAMFDTWGANNCFGEEWIEIGSLTAPKGGVAFVGPTSNTHTTYNNKIDKGIYTGMFAEDMETPGQALLRGKLYMYNVYGDEYYVEYHYKIYCILGDPSIHIWRDVPLAVTVDYPQTILVGQDQVEITVNFTASGQPAANAQVCLTGDEIFATGYCDSEGKVYMDIVPETPDTLKLTVRGKNVYPFQADIIVIQPEELVEPDGGPALDDLDGNLDGLIDPNENGTATFTLKNWGSQTANNVMATLTSGMPDYMQVLTTVPVNYGNLASGAKITGNPFMLRVAENCPVGQLIPVQLHVTSTENSWDYNYDIVINGCNLLDEGFYVNDQGAAEPNYRMDPGETVKLFIAVHNAGNDLAKDVVGILTSDDPFIDIEDGAGAFGTIAINETAINFYNYFVVKIDPSCPADYFAQFNLQLMTSNGNYPYQKNLTLNLPVSHPVPSDYTGPDAYGYYAYSSDDIFDQAPGYTWIEIDQAGTPINISGIGDYTETVSLPFTFKYYGVEYAQLRISTDGWIAFGNGNQTAPVNTTLPNIDNINCMVAGFWDDLYDAETVEGNIYYYNDFSNHRFIIEWDSIARNDFGSEPNVEIFQAVLYDPDFYPTLTGDGEIVFNYKQVRAPESSTIGIENQGQNIGLLYLFNDAYNPGSNILKNEFSIKFTTEPPEASIITGIDDRKEGSMETSDHLSCFPNPFVESTRISYTIDNPAAVSVKILDVEGRTVRILKSARQNAGTYEILWDGCNDAGLPVSAGVYFCQIKSENFRETVKLFLLR
ncbi:MAG: T9SS type A sorting domain-containing protein [Bacteroidales bacterium]|nr:T9SS type A sorting domain-containing protein [Bacteroidales bacterium]